MTRSSRSRTAPRPTDINDFKESDVSLKIITVGDKTDHGGTVISGAPNQNIHGRAVARLGDKVDCPQFYPGGKPHGINKIVTACNTVTITAYLSLSKGAQQNADAS
jgi:uncharacterized Zn-binding protein involved in type VI secretion